ncbi:MAG: type I glutamate--ammonia ligase [Micrococcaceae bacterium]
MNSQQEYVLRTIAERDIKFIRLWFTDVVGSLKSVAISPTEVEGAFEEGIGFDGSSIEGLARISESDMLAFPDPGTFQVLPWRGNQNETARMFCDIKTPDGLPSGSDPRNVLRKTLDKASKLGFTVFSHPEIEFYLLESNKLDADNKPVPIDTAGYFDHEPFGVAQDFRFHAVEMLEAVGIPVKFSHHEGGPGQNEIDLRYADSLTMADSVMTFRTVIKELATMQNRYATFMPKPFTGHPGSGMHTHFSLFEGNMNAFYEEGAEHNLSPIAKHFLAGVLEHAPEFTAVTNQYVNSYKRLWGGGEAPNHVSWGHNNRSALVRVPLNKPDKHQSARLEYRGMDSAANPYLAFSMIIAAGLKGIEEEYELVEETEDNIWYLTQGERKSLELKPLPMTLEHALVKMEKSELVAETMGEKLFDYFLRNKKSEWTDYQKQVTEFELKRFLNTL